MNKLIVRRAGRRYLPALLGLACRAVSLVSAQSTPPELTEEPLVLSPFEVSAAQENGYLATQTLAGTRIKSNLRDVSSSISIVTKQFLDDTKVHNVNDLLVYTVGTETAGPQGNYGGSATTSQRTPQFATRVRGLAAPDLTRDYFLSRIPFDSYNTERVEINRGANAILFGLGSPVGIINHGLTSANFDNFGEVNLGLGDYGSLRGSLDVNRELVDDKLAVRVSTLHDRTKYQQRPAFEEQARAYGALTWKPWKNTRLKVNAETGDIDANRPNAIAPGETISGWILSGNNISDNTVIFSSTNNNFASGVTVLNRPLSQGGVRHTSNPLNRILDLGGGAVFNSSDLPRVGTTTQLNFWQFQTGVVFSNYNVVNADGSIDNLGGTDLPNSSYPTGKHPLDPDADSQFGQEQLRFLFHEPLDDILGTGYNVPGLNDRRAFDWVNNLLFGDSPYQNSNFDTFNIALEQTFLENKAGIELAFDYQRMTESHFTPSSNIHIDNNYLLPVTADGLNQPNPNYLRPFVITGLSTTDLADERNTFRATGFYEFDFRKKTESRWASWLGRHVLTGIYSDQEIEAENVNRSARWTDPMLLRQSGSNDALGIQAQANNFVYLGPPVDPNLASMDEVRINRLDGVKLLNIGYGNPLTHWEGGVQPGTANQRVNGFTPAGAAQVLAVGGPTGMGNILTRNVPYDMLVSGATFRKERIKSSAFNMQSFLLSNLLVGTVGWREDEVTVHEIDTGDLVKDTYNQSVIAGRSASDDKSPVIVSDTTFTWGVVGYWPERFRQLPLESTLSFHYGESSNFQPAVGRIDEYGNALENPRGDTKEYGFTLSMFDRKLFMRVNRYETNLLNASSGIINFSQPTHLYIRWFGEGGRFAENEYNATGLPQFAAARDLNNAAVEYIIANTPQAYREFWGITPLRNEAGNVIGETHNNPAGLADTEDVAAKGTELELVYNPTDNWRIALNVARQEAVRSNIKPVSRAWGSWIMDTILNARVPGYDVTIGELPASIEFLEYHPEKTGRARFGEGWANRNAETTMDHMQRTVLSPLATALSQEGAVSPELREWRVNVVSTYEFKRGPLDGLKVGGALRYQSKVAIGYQFIDTDGDGNLDSGDVNKPYFGPDEYAYDAWVDYRLPFFENVGEWSVGLNVRNLFASDDDLIPIQAHTNGMVSRYRFAPPRTMFLSSRFRF